MGWRGFTLVELLVALALLGVLAAIAVPNFRGLVQENRIAADINRLNASLQAARSAAIRSGSETVVCASSDGRTCLGSGSSDPAWEAGWIAFVDLDGNRDCGAAPGSSECGDGGRILSVASPLVDGTLRSSDHKGYVRYTRRGRADGSLTQFNRCSANGDTRAGFSVIMSGRIARKTAADITCP